MENKNYPAGSATGIDLSGLPTYDPDRDTPGMMELRDTYKDGDYFKVEDVHAALARATPQHPEAPTYWISQRKMIERAIIGLRDGWATRKDADDAIAALAQFSATPQHSVTEQDERKLYETHLRNRGACLNDAEDHAAWCAWQAARAQPLASTAATQPEQASEPKMTIRDGISWPEGYCTDPNGHIVPPAGKHIDWKFGYDIGYAEGLVAHRDSVAAIEKRTRAALAIPASTAASEQPPVCAPTCFYGDCPPCVAAGLRPAAASEQHPDDAAVDRFAAVMKAKMAASRAKGRSGWDDEMLCTDQFLADSLMRHTQKGDPVDVANFAMMLHQRGDTLIAGTALKLASLDFAKRVAAVWIPEADAASEQQAGAVRTRDNSPHDICREIEKGLRDEITALTHRATTATAESLLYRAGWFLYTNGQWTATSSDDPRATILYRKDEGGKLLAAAPDTATNATPGVVEVLAEMVKMIDDGDEHGEGSDWHTRAKAALAAAADQQGDTASASIGNDYKFRRLLVDFGAARFQDVQTTRDRLIAYIDGLAQQSAAQAQTGDSVLAPIIKAVEMHDATCLNSTIQDDTIIWTATSVMGEQLHVTLGDFRRIAAMAAPGVISDPCPQCRRGGVCSTIECGRKRSSELMSLYGMAAPATSNGSDA